MTQTLEATCLHGVRRIGDLPVRGHRRTPADGASRTAIRGRNRLIRGERRGFGGILGPKGAGKGRGLGGEMENPDRH